jgi:hypothetical protein
MTTICANPACERPLFSDATIVIYPNDVTLRFCDGDCIVQASRIWHERVAASIKRNEVRIGRQQRDYWPTRRRR